MIYLLCNFRNFKFAILFSICISGCAQVSKDVSQSQIKSNIEGLELDESHKPTLVYIRPGAPTLANYNRFIIDPISIDYSDPAMKEISAAEIRQLQEYFHSAMTNALTQSGYKVVTRSSEGVLRITFTLSELKAPTASTNVSVLLVPGMSTSVGEVTIEAVFKDAASNVINAVVLEGSRGSYMFNKKPWNTWGDIESAFDNWANGFRDAVDKAHKKH